MVSESSLRNERINMSCSKTRTTYKPSVHPNFASLRHHKQEAARDLIISIEVMPPINVSELRALYEEALNKEALNKELNTNKELNPNEGRDQTVWRNALAMELNRCDKPHWMKRTNEHPSHPTQHARIDPHQPQINQLKDILSPETLRRTFISIPALMRQIQADLTIL